MVRSVTGAGLGAGPAEMKGEKPEIIPISQACKSPFAPSCAQKDLPSPRDFAACIHYSILICSSLGSKQGDKGIGVGLGHVSDLTPPY